MRLYKVAACLLALCLLLCGCAEAMAAQPAPDVSAPAAAVSQAEGTVSVHFIDVGQADCILVSGNGQTMLIDAGNNADGPLVVSYLQNLGITRIDCLVGTHPHEDHIGGLDDVIDAFEIGKIYLSDYEHTTQTYFDVLDAISRKQMKYSVPKAGSTFSLCGGEVQVVGPVRQYENVNNSSIVLRFVYGETSFLFTGDMEADAERDLLDRGGPIVSDVLKVGHHGSSTSTSYVFLREVWPQYAVIMCETGNDYGHPHEEVASRLEQADCTILRTDNSGTIVIETDGKTLSAKAETQETPAASGAEEQSGLVYIGNKNSHVFHSPDCRSLPAERNRVLFESREDAAASGFTPCNNCKP